MRLDARRTHMYRKPPQVRHIARYGFDVTKGGAAQLQLPAPYTPCVQQLPKSGAWMLPAADRPEWMLVRPKAA